MSPATPTTKHALGSMLMVLTLTMTLIGTPGCDDDPGQAAGPHYRARLGVTTSDGLVGTLQFEVHYAGSTGVVTETGDSVDCQADASVAFAEFDDDGDGRLRAVLSDPDGFRTPGGIATCYFTTSLDLGAGSFVVTTTDASAPDGTTLTMLPVVEVTAFRIVVPDPDADPLATTYDVTAAVVSDSGVLGALQFDITHLGASGGFVGAGGSVDCMADVDAALTSFNDRGHGQLSAAFVDLGGFATPTDIATCRFRTREPLDTDSFEVTVADASGPDLQGSVDLPEMAVTRVVPLY